MSLLGWPLLVLTVLLAIAGPVACVVFWTRIRGIVAVPSRIALVVVSQAFAVAAVGVAVNDHYQFFASWDDLFGENGADAAIQRQNGGPGPDVGRPGEDLRRQFHFDHATGAYLGTLTGQRSGIRAQMYVWLPPQYGRRSRLPVVELLPGYPGSPGTWFHGLRGPQRLNDAVRSRQSEPFILVAPVITVVHGKDTECSDIPAGPKVATWLTSDIRSIVTGTFQALPDRGAWGLMGYSTGGFCAAKLALQYPGMFRAGVSLAGYFSPQSRLITRSPGTRAANDPVTIAARRRPPVDLLLGASDQDPGTVPQVTAMVHAVKPPTAAFTYVVPKGGHNTGVWSAMLPKAFNWLTSELSHPQ